MYFLIKNITNVYTVRFAATRPIHNVLLSSIKNKNRSWRHANVSIHSRSYDGNRRGCPKDSIAPLNDVQFRLGWKAGSSATVYTDRYTPILSVTTRNIIDWVSNLPTMFFLNRDWIIWSVTFQSFPYDSLYEFWNVRQAALSENNLVKFANNKILLVHGTCGTFALVASVR